MKTDLMKRLTGASAVVAGLLLVTACTRPFEARVQSFQAMTPTQGQSFEIQPTDASMPGGLEFDSYAELVKTALRQHGFQPASTAGDADLTVRIDYSSGPGRERIATRAGSYAGGWGWGGRGWYYPGWYSPWGGPWGSMWSSPEVYSYTVYPAYLHVAIERRADKQPLFEGRAESTTRVDDLPLVMPKLVEALFTDFPGPATRSKVVKVPTGQK